MKNVILIIVVIITIGLIFYIGYLYSKNMPETVKEKKDLEIIVLNEGAGEEAKSGDNLKVHYTGTLENGTKFDSSLDSGIPFSFVLGAGKVIEGWDKGLLGMKVGEKRKLIIPSHMGYGEYGAGEIPPNATLIFEVELLSINE